MKTKLIALLFALAKMHALEIESIDSPYSNHKIEIGVQRPSSQEFPLLLFLHGASGKGLNGISQSWFDHWLNKGYAVASISMPGYGESTGRKDFCGSFTMKSLNFAIDFIKDKLHVSKFGIIGFGQGAIASALLASERIDIQCVVCSNGGYDLFRHKIPGDVLMGVLQKNGYDLDTHDDEAMAARSPISHIGTIEAPLFLLHRKGNPVISEEEVVGFCDAMTAAKKECYLSFKDKTPEVDAQKLNDEEVLDETEAWVDSIMKNS